MKKDYYFTSERLGFRNWKDSDVLSLYGINSDPEVMRYFPSTATKQQTADFIRRMQGMFDAKGYCYFAVEVLETGEFIGFIGLSDQDYNSHFTPCTDIGWRLSRKHWKKGYAVEGATAVLDFARTKTPLKTIYATAPKSNKNSIAVMERIGLVFKEEFEHPRLMDIEELRTCVLYVTP